MHCITISTRGRLWLLNVFYETLDVSFTHFAPFTAEVDLELQIFSNPSYCILYVRSNTFPLHAASVCYSPVSVLLLRVHAVHASTSYLLQFTVLTPSKPVPTSLRKNRPRRPTKWRGRDVSWGCRGRWQRRGLVQGRWAACLSAPAGCTSGWASCPGEWFLSCF